MRIEESLVNTEKNYSLILEGSENSDLLNAKTNISSVEAGAGIDMVVFAGKYQDYTIEKDKNSNSIRVINKSNEYLTTVFDAEFIQFDDFSLNVDKADLGKVEIAPSAEEEKSQPKIAYQDNGTLITSWTAPQTDQGNEVFAQLYTQDGLPVGDFFKVNTTTVSSPRAPRIKCKVSSASSLSSWFVPSRVTSKGYILFLFASNC